MKCPFCDNEFPMTWRRYLLAPTCRHRCPYCQKRSKLALTRHYIVSLVLLAAFQLLLTVVLIAAYSYGVGSVIIGGLIALAVWIPIDKYADSHRPLVPIESIEPVGIKAP